MPSELDKICTQEHHECTAWHYACICKNSQKTRHFQSNMVNLPQRKKEKYMGAFYLYKPRLHICLDSPAFLCIPRLKQHSQQATQDGTPTYLAQTAPLLVLCYTR
jgi:hypothetical protein